MLRLHTLGTLAVLRDERPVAGAAQQPRRLAILALLARAGERGMTREKLVSYLWPDADEERARRNLNHALYSLRRDLGADEAIEGVKDLRLNPDLIASDLARFERFRREERWADAAAAYGGPFLDGFHLPGLGEFERWVETERASLAHDFADVLERLARDAARAGDHRAAAGWWRKLAGLDPLNARVALELMQSLAHAGDVGAALRHAEVYEALMEQELALAPDQEVVAFAQRLRTQPPPAPAPVPVAALPAAAPSAPPSDDAAAPPAGTSPAAPPTSAPSVEAPPAPFVERRRPPVEAPPAPRRRRAQFALLVASWLLLAALGAAAAQGRLTFLERGAPAAPAASGPPRVAVGLVADYRGSGVAVTAPLRDLLATNLGRLPGLEIVSAARLLELVRQVEGGSDTSAAALAAAARLAGATQLVDGALYALPDGRLRLDLRRSDVATGSVLHALRVEAADLFALVDSGTASFARDFGAAAPGSVAQVTTRSLVAAARYAEGLREYYDGDEAAAARLFDAALADDSLFAMAAYYRALSERGGRIPYLQALRRAQRLAERATDRERLLIRTALASAESDPALLALADSLVARYPAEPDGYFHRGVARLEAGDFAGAIAALREVVRMDAAAPDDERRCRSCEAWGYLVSAYDLLDSTDIAIREAREWRARQPRSTSAAFVLAALLDVTGRDTAGAVPLYLEAAALDGSPGAEARALAYHEIFRERHADAVHRLAESVDAVPADRQATTLWLLAIAQRQAGRYTDALRTARRFREAAGLPEGGRGALPSSALQEAQVLLELGRPREAAAMFAAIARWRVPLDGAPAIARATAWALTHAAAARAAAGDTAGLMALADTIETLADQGLSGRDRRLHHYVRGLALTARGEHAAAVEAYRRAMYTRRIGLTRVNVALARALVASGRPAEAVAVLQPALQGGIEGSNLYVTRAELHEQLAEAWEAAGRPDSARVHWRAVADAWAAADPVLAPRVARARAKAAAR